MDAFDSRGCSSKVWGPSPFASPEPPREKILRDWKGGAEDATGSQPQGALQGARRRKVLLGLSCLPRPLPRQPGPAQ